MDCPHCKAALPAFVDRTDGASKLAAHRNDFLLETPRGTLLRVRVKFARHDTEAGLYHYKVQVAPAADATGDVLKGATGDNTIFPAFSVGVRQDAVLDGRVSLTGELAAAIAQQIETSEARLFAAQQMVKLFGKPEVA